MHTRSNRLRLPDPSILFNYIKYIKPMKHTNDQSIPNPFIPNPSIPRRSFVKTVITAGTATLFAPQLLRAAKPASGEKVRLACCGIGNRGGEIIKELHKTGLAEIVALCDTEMGAPHTEGILKLFPDVPRFQDFRKMFDKMGKDIDAVTAGTPDFAHFPIAMLAMSQGKHVYAEKPIGQSFREIQLMMDAEKKYKVAAQMGNQGHSTENYFQFKTWVEKGIIKDVTKITAFMNSRRRWHGLKVSDYLPKEPIPDILDWDAWLNVAKVLEYNKGYLNGDWRSWFELGNGALGDWGAHIFDTAHEFLKLGLPSEVEAIMLEGHSPLIFPQASTLAFRFPKRGEMPPVELTWYDGMKNLPPLPDNIGADVVDPNIPPPSKGKAENKGRAPGKVIYSKDLVFKGGSHGSILEILGEKGQDMKASLPEIPKSPSNHFKNFLLACQGKEVSRSSFAVAGPLCQAMGLGVIAQRVNAKLVFDSSTQQITNNKVANELLKGSPPRKEWEEFFKL